MIVYVNGKFVEKRGAKISVFDHGFLYGDGIYETLRVYSGKIFRLDEHLERLKKSAEGIQLRLPMSLNKIGQALQKTVATNRHREAVVRLTVTRGPGPYGFDPRPCTKPTLVISSMPFEPYPKRFYETGITLGLVSVRRNDRCSLPPAVKSTNCLNGILAKMESLELNAHEGAMLTLDGFLAEGTVSNVFLVKNKIIFTPKLEGSVLAGVTRELVCLLARKAGYLVKEIQIPYQDILTADEVFLTNTTMEVMPVGKIIFHPHLRRELPILKRGQWKRKGNWYVTKDLQARFKNYLCNCTGSYENWSLRAERSNLSLPRM